MTAGPGRHPVLELLGSWLLILTVGPVVLALVGLAAAGGIAVIEAIGGGTLVVLALLAIMFSDA